VFADWDIAEQFSSVIVESRDIGPDEAGRMGYYILNRACILFFCKSTIRSGSVTKEPLQWIRAVADPDVSDFEISDEEWTFSNEDGGTIVRYELRAKPGFWIPPVIGPYLMKRKLRNDSGDAMQRIEKLGQQRAVGGE
jgi:hypothetical protein